MPTIDANTPYWIAALLSGSYGSISNTALKPVPKEIAAYFPDHNPSYFSTFTDLVNVVAFTPAEQDFTMQGLERIEQLIDVDFYKTTDPAVGAGNAINFFKAGFSDADGYGSILSPGIVLPDYTGPTRPGGVFISTAPRWGDHTITATHNHHLMAHEVGHALGLGHPEEATVKLQPLDQTFQWVTPTNRVTHNVGAEFFTFDFRPLDIAALQFHYGPSLRVRTGNDVYALDEAGPNFIWDGVGNDAIDASGASQGATLYLTPGQWGHIGAKATYITAPGQVTVNYNSSIENLIGTRFDDKLYGTTGGNTITGGGGNDVLHGLGGGDTLDGGEGLDRAVFTGARSSYTIERQVVGFQVEGTGVAVSDGLNRLLGIERVQFADRHVALDLTGGGNAELVARLIGSFYGTQHVTNADYCGIGLWALDSGTYTFTRLVETVLGGKFGPRPDNGAVVDLLFQNIVGQLPSSADRATFVGGLERGEYTQTQLVDYAVKLDATGTKIGLTGLQESGLVYNEFLG